MEVIALTSYVDWLAGLKNRKDTLRISARILRIEQNNFGDSKSVGGTKQRQQKDIATAKDLAARV